MLNANVKVLVNSTASITAEIALLNTASPNPYEKLEFSRIKHLWRKVLFLLRTADYPRLQTTVHYNLRPDTLPKAHRAGKPTAPREKGVLRETSPSLMQLGQSHKGLRVPDADESLPSLEERKLEVIV
jgi:hypothetical protein